MNHDLAAGRMPKLFYRRTILKCAVLLSWTLLYPVPNEATAAEPIELGSRYLAKIDVAATPKGYDWSCNEEDVWKLNQFSLEVKDRFQLELKESQVVFGHHEKNVLWAVVFPDQPTELSNVPAGQGEHVVSIWLRFHPARLQELFPPSTVVEVGRPDLIPEARRIAAHKVSSSWQAGGKPMVPQPEMLTVDIETQEGPRRFFSLDTQKGKVEYIDAFKSRPLPVAKKLDQKSTETIFDLVWTTFDKEYAMFVVKPEVDWDKVREEYRPLAGVAKTNHELAATLAKMLAELKDLHINVQIDGTFLPVYQRDRPLNANRGALPSLIGKLNPTRTGVTWGITDDGIGYLAIDRLVDKDLPRAVEEILLKMEGTRGLIIDLRFNGGGNELLGREISGWFLDQERAYASNQFRNGPRHEDLTEPFQQRCPIKKPWHYVAPVIVLQGQRTMSSAESFVLMLSQAPQVTTMGDRTAGSSGNPRVLDAGAGIQITVPRWNPLDADGEPFDTVGIAPNVVMTANADGFQGKQDPVLSTALEHLRTKAKFEGPALTKRP